MFEIDMDVGLSQINIKELVTLTGLTRARINVLAQGGRIKKVGRNMYLAPIDAINQFKLHGLPIMYAFPPVFFDEDHKSDPISRAINSHLAYLKREISEVTKSEKTSFVRLKSTAESKFDLWNKYFVFIKLF